MSVDVQRSRRLPTALRHLICVLLLMWPAIINRQPMFFIDTTNYVRAADVAVALASGNRITTDWTERYRADLVGAEKTAKAPLAVGAGAPRPANDLKSGSIMSGRSPYFGALLYLGYVLSDFWLFVLAQAAVSYFLMLLALRSLELERAQIALGVVVVLSAVTSLPFYNSLLMPDALAAFGMLGLVILATDRGQLKPLGKMSVGAIVILSAMSHLTHILILAGMSVLLCIIAWRLRSIRSGVPPALLIGGAATLIGLASLALTSAVVERAFNRPPQLAPLFTSRFIEDGPGRSYILSGCDDNRFTVCRIPRAAEQSAFDFLWSTHPAKGVFMLASPEVRQQLSAEDKAFAIAVFRAYPIPIGMSVLRNTFVQLGDFTNGGLNQDCFAQPSCWSILPDRTRSHLRSSLNGQNAWPAGLLDVVHYAAVILSVFMMILSIRRLAAPADARWTDLRTWTILILGGVVINAIVCGGISIPQYRYGARIVWLLPFLAAMIVLVRRFDTKVSPLADDTLKRAD